MKYAKGEIYEGHYKDGYKDGRGILNWPSG